MARRYACAWTVSTAAAHDVEVAVIGGGVVGCAVALALARHGVAVCLLEAEPAFGLAASGTNSGLLHTGFDSPPEELETELILLAARLRDPVLEALGVPVLRCGALMCGAPSVPAVIELARVNGVTIHDRGDDSVEIPGEAVTDPVFYTLALAAAAEAHGAELRLSCRVEAIEVTRAALALQCAPGDSLRCRIAVNCAGLHADGVARMVGDESFNIYPRKGEFLVFDSPPGPPLERILLPVHTARTRGVLVFPTIDGKIVAGPTAIDLEDKDDWSVRPAAAEEILPNATQLHPPLDGRQPIGAYAGLRPAGRGINYVIGPSSSCSRLVNAAAIRSTGLTASLGIAQRISRIVESLGVRLGPEAALRRGAPPVPRGPWWQRTAEHRATA
jgi:glycerol-3-phosphate dehydrogenase